MTNYRQELVSERLQLCQIMHAKCQTVIWKRKMAGVIADKKVLVELKGQIYQTVIKAIMLFGAEF